MSKPVLETRIYLMQAGPKLFAFGTDRYGPDDVPWDFTKGDPGLINWTDGDVSYPQKNTVLYEGMNLPESWDEPGRPEPGVLYRIFVDYFGNITHKTTVFED
jgi:hypothetical protein